MNRSTGPNSFDRDHLNSFWKSFTGNPLKPTQTPASWEPSFFPACAQAAGTTLLSHAYRLATNQTVCPETQIPLTGRQGLVQSTAFTGRHQSAFFAKAAQYLSWVLVKQGLRKHLKPRIKSTTLAPTSAHAIPSFVPIHLLLPHLSCSLVRGLMTYKNWRIKQLDLKTLARCWEKFAGSKIPKHPSRITHAGIMVHLYTFLLFTDQLEKKYHKPMWVKGQTL